MIFAPQFNCSAVQCRETEALLVLAHYDDSHHDDEAVQCNAEDDCDFGEGDSPLK